MRRPKRGRDRNIIGTARQKSMGDAFGSGRRKYGYEWQGNVKPKRTKNTRHSRPKYRPISRRRH